MKKILKDYFSFNSRERVAILFLCCLMVFFWILPNWYSSKSSIPNDIGWKQPVPDTLNSRGNIATSNTNNGPILSSVQLFTFDPNELPSEGWEKLGLNKKTIQTILHFREKGGRFREPADLKKIWGMPSKLAIQLIPYVTIPQQEKSVKRPLIIINPKMPDSILINQVTIEDLMVIPGFNKSLAARMIKFRDKIGGFKNLEQVRKTYGLTDSLYQLMAPILIL